MFHICAVPEYDVAGLSCHTWQRSIYPSSIEVSGPDLTVTEDNLRTAPGYCEVTVSLFLTGKPTFGKCTTCTLG